MPKVSNESAKPEPTDGIGATPADNLQAAAQARQTNLAARGLSGVQLVEVAPFGPGGVEHWRLANGLSVLLAADAHAPVVAVHTWLRVGSADESRGQTGIAHLLEHLMFKSTLSRPAGTFDRLLEAHGASANAGTWLDWTMYHATVPAKVLAQILELEADRLVNLALTPPAVVAELAVVQNERRETLEDDPDGQVDAALMAGLYGNTAYGVPTIGQVEDLEKLNKDKVLAFYRKHYAAANAVVVVAGGGDPNATLADIAKLYGGLPTVALLARAKPPTAPLAVQLARQTLAIDASASRVAVAWPTVPLDHPAHPALALLAEVLCGSDAAVLERILIDAQQLATSIHCEQSDLRLGGHFAIRMTLRPGKTAAQALAALDTTLAALHADKLFTPKELVAARTRLQTDHLRELAGVDGRAEVLGHAWATGLPLSYHATWWAAIAGQTPQSVLTAAKAWLDPVKRCFVLADPVRREPTTRKKAAPSTVAKASH